jgi:hypothetical protein
VGIGRTGGVTAAALVLALATVAVARQAAGTSGFGPAQAQTPEASVATVASTETSEGSRSGFVYRDSLILSAAEPAVEAPAPTPEPTPEPAPSEPVATPAPTVVRQAVTAPGPAATPATCPATWFCYPRLAIAGPIVPYTDCSGGTDVGTSIRSYSCLSDHYLMGHAYTQFGRVTQWRAGDVVFAWGQSYTVTGAVTQRSCEAPTVALAPLSMQTSLTSSSCGAVLVVQAR